MLNENVNSKPLSLLSALLFLQAASYIVVFLDIPIARQVLLFVYLTFVPGYLIVKLLRFNFELLETLVFSVGFSVAFLMLVGLALNELGFMAGLSQPLSGIPLLIVLNNVILAFALIAYLRNEASSLPRISFSLAKWTVPLLIPLVFSVVGAIFVDFYGDNRLLLLMILAVSLVVAVLTLKGNFPSGIFAFTIFIIGISLLYHSSLISRYLCPFGSDIPGEYYAFKYTQMNGYWNSTPPTYWGLDLGKLNGMLSITVLPTVWFNLLNLDSTWIFKVMFPFIFAFVPLCLYCLWRESFGDKCAFISVFFFMATFTFYTELLGLSRQMIGELFFVLLLFVLLNKNMGSFQKMVSFTIFSFGLVVSHYALAAIFLFFISFALVVMFVLKRPSRNITVDMVVFFFAIMFTWYIYTSGAATFDSILEVGDYLYRQLGDFFNPATRGETVLRGLGLEAPPTVWNAVGRFFAYLTEAFIVLGFVGLVTKRVRVHRENEFFIFSLVSMAFLAMLILVPGLAESLNMTRFYHVLLFFLAPLCILGAGFIVNLVFKRKNEIVAFLLLLIVLVPYFLFQTGFVYEVTGSDSWSIPLSSYRMSALRLYNHYGYMDAYSVYGARWLSANANAENSAFYADVSSGYTVLTTYGLLVRNKYSLSDVTVVAGNSFVYLNTLNVVYGLVPYGQLLWNTSKLSFIFDDLNLVYANDGSEVYQNP